jgi:hypothetical protein
MSLRGVSECLPTDPLARLGQLPHQGPDLGTDRVELEKPELAGLLKISSMYFTTSS